MFRRFPVVGAGALSAALVLVATVVGADEPVIVLREDVSWRTMGNSSMEMAVLAGDPMQAGPYSFMVWVPRGTRLQPHSHPVIWRHCKILGGKLLWASDDTFDRATMAALTPASFWTEPSGANHHGYARDGEVLALGTTMGPSGMTDAADK